MADAAIVLPGQKPAAPEDAGRPWRRLGVPLPQRPTERPEFGNEAAARDGKPLIRLDVDGDPAVRISLFPGAPAIRETPEEDADFGENLARRMADSDRQKLCGEIEDGVTFDIQSRAQWIQQYAKGLDLLGTKVEEPAQGGGQRRNVSRVGHPLMMEAMVRYQAGAEAEMLPAAGPCKVATTGRASSEEELKAKDFQDDFNYVMTEVMREYYPDTSSMLMHEGFCGLGYKKVFRDPLRQRPTSQSILAPNLIVSEEATDLQTAMRVTHEIEMSRSALKRMQIFGDYLNVDVGAPSMGDGLGQVAQRKLKEAQGLVVMAQRPQDQPYLVWESDSDIDPFDYGLDGAFERRAPDGLPLPYRVAVSRSSHQVLGVWRNWRPRDQMFRKRNMYVKFSLVPALGYHPWGFLHLLGNQTRALRAIWRLLIDAGMFSNFPGGLKAKNARLSTTEVAPGPGEWIDVDGMIGPNAHLSDLFMPMPYKGPDSVLVQLAEIIKADSMRLGATAQLEVGEGRTNVPVGTVMAMVEQQVQLMAGVHKRNHVAQREELHLIRELFAEDPDSLNRFCALRPRPNEAAPRIWSAAEEFMDLDLVPASDPNVPAQVHRLMMGNVLVMLAQQAPEYFDVPEVLRTAVQLIGANPDKYVVRPDSTQPPPIDPKTMAKAAELQQKQAEAALEYQIEIQKIALQRARMESENLQAAAENTTQREMAGLKAQTETAKAVLHHAAGAAPPEPPPIVVPDSAPAELPA